MSAEQDEIIMTEATSINLSGATENEEDANSSCSTKGLDIGIEVTPVKSTRDEYYCTSETMPHIGPSLPVTAMSTSPITKECPVSNFGTPVVPKNNEEKSTPIRYTMSLVSDYGYSDDEDAIIEMHNIDKDLLPVVHIKEEVIDSDMDETLSKDYASENKNFSPNVANPSKLLNEEDKDEIIETDRHNIDKDLLPVVLIKEEVEMIETDKEESCSKDSQNEDIEVSSIVVNPSRLLNSENSEKYRYTVDIASGTDDSESDSEDSSSDGFSSSSSSESDSDSEDETTSSSQKQVVKEPPEEPNLDDQALLKLPPIEDLKITVSEEESQPIGTIFSIVEQQVVIQALPNVPPIDLESILFMENGKKALGKVFDVFGPVEEPFYTVRFNSNDHIKEKGFNIGDPVYFAPQTEHTQFVVLADLMRAKGSDASWENNNEPPSKYVDYSDDEQESAARQQRKQEKLQAEGVPVNEFKPQRKRPRGASQNPNPFSNSGSQPSRAPMRFAQRQHHQSWTRPRGHTRFRPPMHNPPNQNPFGQYDQRNSEYQFGGPPQFPPAGPSNNWHQTGTSPNWIHAGPNPNWHQSGPGNNWTHTGPRMPMGPPGVNEGPPPHMGPPPHHGGPPHMPPLHQPPPPFPPYSDAPIPHQNHTYPGTSQENWWAPGPPSTNYFPTAPPPPHGQF